MNYEVIANFLVVNYKVMVVMNYVGFMYVCYELCCNIYFLVKTLNNVLTRPTFNTGSILEPVLKDDHIYVFFFYR